MKYFRLEQRVKTAAMRGTTWLLTRGRRYALHETTNALVHLDLCLKLYPSNAFFLETAVDIPNWFSQRSLDRLRKFRSASPAFDVSTHLILLPLLETHGISLIRDNYFVTRMARVEHRLNALISRIRNLDLATDYLITSYGLSLNGITVDTSILLKLQDRLPTQVTVKTNLESKRILDAFNYATHIITFKSDYFKLVKPRLASLDSMKWLMFFWKTTHMREDVEYLSEFLNCLGATESSIPQCDLAASLLRIIEAQRPSGCWPGSNATRCYTRFHSTYRAADALHLSSRLLQ